MADNVLNYLLIKNYRYFGGARSVKEISDSQREYYIDMLILDQSGTVKSYQTAAGYAIPNGTTASHYYQVKDWLGTAHVTLDAAGAIKNAMDYYPYGKKLPGRNSFSTNQEGYRYQYTGHEFDGETGYQYHGARYYNEELARYMSVDRYAMKFFNQSPYVYAGNMPVNRIDVNGDYSEEVAKGMAERGGDNGYTTKVVANPNKEGDFGVNYIKTVKGIKYEGVQFDGKFEGIVKGGLKKLSSYQKSAAAGFADGISPGISEGKVTAILGVSRMVEAAKSIGSSFSQDPTGNTFVYNSIKSLVWDYSVLGVNSRLKSANSSYEKGKVWGDLFYTVGTTIAPMAAESSAFKSAPTSEAQGGLNLFKWGAEQTTRSTGWKSGDYMLHLPDKGTPKLNWEANYGSLRKEMGLGNPIYDSYRLQNGNLIPTGGFLNAERFTLQSRGWIYNPSQGAWLPPIK